MASTDPVPRGFKTVEQWSEDWALSVPRTRENLRIAAQTAPPLMVVERLRVLDASGRVASVPHYAEAKYALKGGRSRPDEKKNARKKKARR